MARRYSATNQMTGGVGPLFDTGHGVVRGASADGVEVFHGIPYADQPKGPFRWRQARPPRAWTGVADASRPGPAAPQVHRARSVRLHGYPPGMDEGCLHLSIFRPAQAANLPVLIWFHGGAFVSGHVSAPCYHAARLARLGRLVVVVAAYRLGAPGWLAHRDLDDGSGAWANWGLSDQSAAVGWVSERASALGGDPGRVVVGGQSAGALSALLLALSSNSPAIAGVIAHSPVFRLVAERSAADFAEDLAREILGPDGAVTDLRQVDPLRLAEGVERLARDGRGVGPFPVSDDGGGVPDLTTALARVPVLVGSNRDEGSHFFDQESGDEGERLERMLARRSPDANPAEVREWYRAWLADRGGPTDDRALLSAIWTDLQFRRPVADFAARQPVAYRYLLEHSSPNPRLGATHSIDVPLLFGTFDATDYLAEMCGSGPAVRVLSDEMISAWSAFCHRGDPSMEWFDWPRGTAVGLSTDGWRAEPDVDRQCEVLL